MGINQETGYLRKEYFLQNRENTLSLAPVVKKNRKYKGGLCDWRLVRGINCDAKGVSRDLAVHGDVFVLYPKSSEELFDSF